MEFLFYTSVERLCVALLRNGESFMTKIYEILQQYINHIDGGPVVLIFMTNAHFSTLNNQDILTISLGTTCHPKKSHLEGEKISIRKMREINTCISYTLGITSITKFWFDTFLSPQLRLIVEQNFWTSHSKCGACEIVIIAQALQKRQRAKENEYTTFFQ